MNMAKYYSSKIYFLFLNTTLKLGQCNNLFFIFRVFVKNITELFICEHICKSLTQIFRCILEISVKTVEYVNSHIIMKTNYDSRRSKFSYRLC